MTILITVFDSDEGALVVADTRKSRNGKPISEECVKLGIINFSRHQTLCGRMIYGITGLFEVESFEAKQCPNPLSKERTTPQASFPLGDLRRVGALSSTGVAFLRQCIGPALAERLSNAKSRRPLQR